MKKKEVIYLISVFIFSLLFYKQQAGLNFFIFSLIVSFGWYIIKPELLSNRLWLFFAIGSMLGGFAVWFYGSTLSLWACILSLSLLSAVSFSIGSTVALAVIYSAFSFISAPVRMLIDAFSYRSKSENATKSKLPAQIGAAIIIMVIIILFFVLYQKSNTLFKQFTQQIDLSWINLNWLMFTVLGAIILYGFYYPVHISSWYKNDLSQPNKLQSLDDDSQYTFLNRRINLQGEYSAGLILLILLNLLILTVNLVDMFYLYAKDGIPEGMTYSEFVHQGTANLILSIVIAIMVIMYLLRGRQNFVKNKWLKSMAFIWVLQNALLLSSAAYKNHLYILEYALTYKRIGVYIYLLLAVTGLIFTLIKVKQSKSNWYLLRKNSIAFVAILVISSLFNWDAIITRHNMKNSVNVDYNYILSLGYYPIPELLAQDELLLDIKYFDEAFGDKTTAVIEILHSKLFRFICDYDERGWRSHVILRSITMKKTKKFIEEEGIPLLIMPRYGRHQMHIERFWKTEGFFHGHSGLYASNIPLPYLKARYLKLSGNRFTDTKAFAESERLEYLDLSNNGLKDISHLSGLKSLRKLNIRNNRNINWKNFQGIGGLEELNISQNHIDSSAFLSLFPSLEKLDLQNMSMFDWENFPSLQRLKHLNISSNSFYNMMTALIGADEKLPSLEHLKMGTNNIITILSLTNYLQIADKSGKYESDKIKALFPLLNNLELPHNKLTNINGLQYFPLLETVNLRNNEIRAINAGPPNTKLCTLYVSGNNISNIDGIGRFPNLKWLDISSNDTINTAKLLKLKKLELLNIMDCHIDDYLPLQQMSSLKVIKINAGNNDVLSIIGRMDRIEELHLRPDAELDYSTLRSMKSIKRIIIYGVGEKEINEAKHALRNICTEVYRYENPAYVEPVEHESSYW